MPINLFEASMVYIIASLFDQNNRLLARFAFGHLGSVIQCSSELISYFHCDKNIQV